MITGTQIEYIGENAYLPEHLPHYVTAVSGAEPFLFGDFLVYIKKDQLIFIGYPFKVPFDEKRMRNALEDAINRFKPESVSLTAPAIPSYLSNYSHAAPDYYYRLDLSALSISQKLRNMLSRAGKELSLEKNRNFNEEHRKIIEDFLKIHPVDDATRFIFNRIGEYLSSSNSAWIFNAKNKRGDLAAFDVAEFGAKDYAFYMFNFSSESLYMPGASDLILSKVIECAKAENKKYINLGLGINPGITFFKRKWGGVPFAPYNFCLYKPQGADILGAFLQKL